jgi:hypothetical protein
MGAEPKPKALGKREFHSDLLCGANARLKQTEWQFRISASSYKASMRFAAG